MACLLNYYLKENSVTKINTKMKKLVFPLLLLLVELSYGQTNYYTFNQDSLYSEKAVRLRYEKDVKEIPGKYVITPTIYHRIVKNDSIINYISFIASKSDSIVDRSKFEISFKQDSLFLFLNKKLPEFILKDMNDNEFSSSQLIGKPALLNYWSTYCAPCVEEIPQLNDLKVKYGDKMNFIALTESTCKKDSLTNFFEKHPFNFYILQNADKYKMTLKIGAIPINIFIDKDGYIRYIQRNFPYSVYDPEKGIKLYDSNNYFVKIIEELVKKQ